MSLATKAAMDQAADSLTTVTAAWRAASTAENDALTVLMDLRDKRATLHVNPTKADDAMLLLEALDTAENAHASCEKRTAALSSLKDDMAAQHARAVAEHKAVTEREAKPAAMRALDASANAFSKWCAAHASVMADCHAAGIQTSGTGWSNRFVDAARAAGVASSLGW